MTTADITASVNGETIDQLNIGWGESVDIKFFPSEWCRFWSFLEFILVLHLVRQMAMKLILIQTLMV